MLSRWKFPGFTLALAIFAMLVAGAAHARQTKCGGVDLLAELTSRDPTTKARIAAAEARQINGNAVLWRIEKPGIAPSFLLGTIHSTDRSVARITDNLKAAIGSVQRVAIEVVDPATGTAKAMAANPRLFMSLDGSEGTAALLAPPEFRKVVAAAQEIQPEMTAQALGILKPWMMTLLFAMPPCELRTAKQGGGVFDNLVMKSAVANGARAIGLETATEQLSAFASLSLADQVAILRSTIANLDRAEDLLFTTKQLYIKRRLGAMPVLTMEMAGKDALQATRRFFAAIVDKRNLRMRDRALPLLAKGRTLIAVGALHLVGETGLVNQFRKAGYKLTAIE